MRVNKTYTYFVKALRLILPALVIISVGILVIWPILNQEQVPQEIITPSNQEKPLGVAEDALQIIKPEFTGMDSKNRPYIITAETVYQGTDKEADMTLVNPVADLELSSTRWVSLRANNGVYRPSQENLTLTGAVTLSDNTGYRLTTEKIDVDLKKGTAISKTTVTGSGPVGSVDARGMTLALDGNPFVSFTGPGKFIIYPENVDQ